MKVHVYFRSLTDWSHTERSEELVDLLAKLGLRLTKADEIEPLRKPYDLLKWETMWRGRGTEDAPHSCTILFKGEGATKFSGSVSWYTHLHPGTERFNTIQLRLENRKMDTHQLLAIGDALFSWSNAVFGMISRDSLLNLLGLPPASRKFLPGVFWVNYFGPCYLEHPDFHMQFPHDAVGDGIRVQLTDLLDDPRLVQVEFVNEVKTRLGLGWFAQGPADGYKVPAFDFDQLWR